MEFYRETTEGFANKYVRDQMFGYDAIMVQIARRWIRIGDSDTQTMDGLVPVT